MYSLLADPLNLHAVGKVFAAEGREIDRPLPLLVTEILMAEDLATEVKSRC